MKYILIFICLFLSSCERPWNVDDEKIARKNNDNQINGELEVINLQIKSLNLRIDKLEKQIK